MKNTSLICGLVAVSLLFSGCGKKNNLPILPEGIQEATGVIVPAPYDKVRRGSHLLHNENGEDFYLESKVIFLGNYEDKLVTVQGIFDYNEDPRDLPVMLVSSLKEDAASSTQKTYDFDRFGISLSVPEEWAYVSVEEFVQFIVDDEGRPIVVIGNNEGDLPSGKQMMVDGVRSIRRADSATGRIEIAIPQGDEQYVSIIFDPSAHPNTPSAEAAWSRIVSSITLHNKPDTANNSTSGEESPYFCGGIAGLVCPAGYRCEITNKEEGTGKCISI